MTTPRYTFSSGEWMTSIYITIRDEAARAVEKYGGAYFYKLVETPDNDAIVALIRSNNLNYDSCIKIEGVGADLRLNLTKAFPLHECFEWSAHITILRPKGSKH